MIETVLDVVFRATLATSIATVLVLVLRAPMRRLVGAQRAYALWLVVPLSLIAMAVPRAPVATSTSPTVSVMQSVSAQRSESVTTSFAWQTPVAITWGLGAFAFALVMVVRQRRFVRELDERSGVIPRKANGPAVIGAFRARIVLPSDFTERYDVTEQALILAHERMHVARHDGIANLVASALLVPFWFNPLLHYASRRHRLDQELACDAAVLRERPGQVRPYAAAMLKTELAAHSLPVGCHWHDRHPLVERIAMLTVSLPGTTRRRVGTFVMIVVGLVCSGAIHALQPAPAALPASATRATALPQDLAGYRAAVRLSIDGELVADSELVAHTGEGMTISGTGKAFWRASLVAHSLGGERWEIGGTIEHGEEGNVIENPVIRPMAGKPASLEITDREGKSKMRFEVTVWPVDADEMRALEAEPEPPEAPLFRPTRTSEQRAPSATDSTIAPVAAVVPVALVDPVAPVAPLASIREIATARALAPLAELRGIRAGHGSPAAAPQPARAARASTRTRAPTAPVPAVAPLPTATPTPATAPTPADEPGAVPFSELMKREQSPPWTPTLRAAPTC